MPKFNLDPTIFEGGLSILQEAVSKAAFGRSYRESVESGICVCCGKQCVDPETKEFDLTLCPTETSQREYPISGLCNSCFNSIIADPDGPLDDPAGSPLK